MRRSFLLSSAACAVLSCLAVAGDIDPQLKRVLAGLAPKQRTTAFVMLSDQVQLKELVARLDAMNATRAFRHEIVVRSLQGLAGATQPIVVAALDRLKAAGELDSYVTFWAFNGFAVRGTRAAFEQLALMPAVGTITWAGSDEPGERDLIVPTVTGGPEPLGMGAETGLLECKADYVWAKGFTGKRTVVCNVDTGVDGNHPALKSRWRGTLAGVAPKAAWHDPIANTTFPNGTRSSHGTHTMGTICGDDGAANLIGMAPGALWIASNPIDASGTRAQKNVWYNQGIQWTADPDGNPSTVDDVPDVCSNSWGVRDPANGVPPCATVFHAALDAAEASTVIYAWANGNEGTTGPRVPSDRADSPTNTFTVGALEAGSLLIASFSSRGPSPCLGAIKPEVSARGVNVRSAIPNGGYTTMSGTSMATPHVAGGLALLRDVFTELSVTRAKELLMETADDLGTAGEDNDYGWGRINMQRAYDKLVLEIPPVAISVMGTLNAVKEGTNAVAHIVLSSYSAIDEMIEVSLEFDFDGLPTGYYFAAPFVWKFPAGLSNRDAALRFTLAIPSGLPNAFIGKKAAIRGTVKRPAGAVLSTAKYQFVLTR